MKKALRKFKDVKVLVFGDLMLDRYWFGDVQRISPEAPVPVINLKKEKLIAGGAGNVATNVCGLGAKVFLVGVLGNDVYADEFKASLHEKGISSRHILYSDKRPTTVKTRVVANNQQVARVDQEVSESFEESFEEEVLNKLEELVDDIDVVIISDYAKGLITENTASRLITLAGEKGKKVLVDPKGKIYSKYKLASILTPNQKESLEACNLSYEGFETLEKAGEILLKELHLENLVITRGEKGMLLFSKDKERPIGLDTNARNVFDVTGAGDTVIATLAVGIGAGLDFYKACSLANIAAGIVVEKIGTSPIEFEELEMVVDYTKQKVVCEKNGKLSC